MTALLHHIALGYTNQNDASIFFTKVLDLHFVRQFELPSFLSAKIFGINDDVLVDVFENQTMRVEVFYDKVIRDGGYTHICIEIDDKKDFLSRCKTYNISWFIVEKNNKELLFVYDHYKNLYEIKLKNLKRV